MYHLNQKATAGLTTGVIIVVLLAAFAIYSILRFRKQERTKKLKQEANTACHSVMVPFAAVSHLQIHLQEHGEKGQLIRNQRVSTSGSGSEETSSFDREKSDEEKTERHLRTGVGLDTLALDVRPSTATTGTSSGASFTTCER
ncbi:hypothetical protein F5Y18DRAFT_422004 [Xylariaceae sp. FL1019]|nr:hypothetical protein F5Y18DRAFT_422004 [Xylariaceae sp. FL1019]